MPRRLFFLALFTIATAPARAQSPLPSSAQTPPPSPEHFVNIAFSLFADSTRPHYFLVAGADTCRFVKYDYDELASNLLEPIPISVLNELAEKVYHSNFHYDWKKESLSRAVCITRRQADSILSLVPPEGDPTHNHDVFSFSLPEFTDDGKYAVIDFNMTCGGRCGLGSTCFFHLTPSGWKFIGLYFNWSA
jgi:hypothetical protein